MRALATWTLVVVFSVSALSQGLQHDWDGLKALSTGATVRVEQLGGSQDEGRLVSVDDTEMAIVVRATTIVLDRQSIRQIHRVGRPVRKRAVLGLLIGGGGGAILGYSAAEANKGLWTALMATGWAAIGALIGVVDGLRGRDYQLIYLNPSP